MGADVPSVPATGLAGRLSGRGKRARGGGGEARSWRGLGGPQALALTTQAHALDAPRVGRGGEGLALLDEVMVLLSSCGNPLADC